MAEQLNGTNISSEETIEIPTGFIFPQDKLKRRLRDATKIPLVLVACKSFSPITALHLQLFGLAERYVERTGL